MRMLEKQFGGGEGLGDELDRMFEAFGAGGGACLALLCFALRLCGVHV